MALPTLITVIGKLLRADGEPSKGFVYFYSDVSVLSSGDETVMIPSYVRAVVDAETGEFTCEVPASDDPAWTPEGWTWRVVVNTPTFKDDFLTVVPYDAVGGEIDFSALVPAEDGGSALYAAYNHTHDGIGEGAVTSVSGRTGDVVLTKTDVGLASVDNTSDANKPVSTATQTALDLTVHKAGAESLTGVKDFTVGFKVNDRYQVSSTGGMDWGPSGGPNDVNFYRAGVGLLQTDYTFNAAAFRINGTDLQTTLNGKAATSHTHTISQVTDLETQLEGKQPAGDYLVAADIDNLISDETFTEGMNQKLDNTHGIVSVHRRSSPGAPTTGAWVLGDLVLDSIGVLWYCTVSGTPGTWTTQMQPSIVAADHNLAGWTFAPELIQGSLAQITAGLSYVARVKNFGSTVSNIHMHLTGGGGSLTSGQCFASVHTDAGVQIGITGTLHSTGAAGWGDGGYKTLPLVGGPFAVTPGAWLKVRWWWNGSTGPVISRAVNSSGVITGAGLVNPNFRFAVADSGLTTTGPTTIGTMTASPTAYWVAVS